MTCVVAATILWLTLAPKPLGESSFRLFEHADKVVHAAMFFVLTLACIADYIRNGRRISAKRVWSVAVLSAVSGGAIELLQMLLPTGRSGDLLDFAADIAGAFLGAVAVLSYIRVRGS